MTLNDSLFTTMTSEQWTSTILPKVYGSKNLHDITLSQPLDFFILLSSLHSFIGNPGQANYAAGCAYQVALAQYRNRAGLPATAIDLGIVSDVGYVIEKKNAGKKIRVQEFTRIKEGEMLALIELGIREPMLGHLVTGLDSNLDSSEFDATATENTPFFARDPVLSHLHYLRPHLKLQKTAEQITSDSDSNVAPTLSLAAQLSSFSSSSADPSTLKALVLTALLKKLSRSLMMEPSEIDAGRSLAAYGADSLVAVELKNWVLRETKAQVSVFDIMQSSSVNVLVERIVGKLVVEQGK